MRLNRRGDYCAGNQGGGPISVNGVEVARGNRPRWLTDDEILFQSPDPATLVAYHVGTRELRQVDGRGANDLDACAGTWLALTPARLRGSHIPELPGVGMGSIAPDGTIGWIESYHVPRAIQILDGPPIEAPGLVRDLQVLSRDAVLWTDGAGRLHTWGLPPVQLPDGGPCFAPRGVLLPDGMLAVVYHTHDRLLLQIGPEPVGHVLHDGPGTHGPDLCLLGDTFRVVWARNIAETPESVTVRDVPLDAPRVPLSRATPPVPTPEEPPADEIPTPAIAAWPRKLWIAPYFSHSEKYGDTPRERHVGNAILVVEDETDPGAMDRTLARVNKLGMPMIVEGARASSAAVNRVVAWYVKHERDVPRALSLQEKPVVCYRDVETAGEWPSERPAWLTDRVWPAVQAYRRPGESLAAFEARVGAMLERVKSYGRPMVLVPRFDDFNGSSTVEAILACMPIYDRWVREYFVVAILPFSDRRGHGIARDARLHAWARAFLLAVPVRPNRFDWWTPDGAAMTDVLRNKIGQDVELVALSPEEKRYLLERL